MGAALAMIFKPAEVLWDGDRFVARNPARSTLAQSPSRGAVHRDLLVVIRRSRRRDILLLKPLCLLKQIICMEHQGLSRLLVRDGVS